ncbi:pantothenate kinase [Oscillospiraceae bacterium HV4-5-C5C]|nr:pantothenate kinase [Oscillospiraceae bacterium HV4-5-C5C]
MKLVIGLDIGGSTTKIVGLTGHDIVGQLLVKSDNQIASAYGALGMFLNHYHLKLQDVGRLVLTGVGQTYLDQAILDLPTFKVDEMTAVGQGGLFLSALPEAVVVSMGTGTALVHAGPQAVWRVIGSGVGGGTLLGLSRALLGTRDFDKFEQLAALGDTGKVDLTVGDIAAYDIVNLHQDATASNFGNLIDEASPEDTAAGIANLVFQTIGTIAALTCWKERLDCAVFTGNLTLSASGRQVLKEVGDLYQVRFLVPGLAEFATAIGAALTEESQLLKA